ncbi:alpha/beta hydrolase [Demequina pelophila]|uniref:alpha/beta hydrolase n=1 Tax=Demequina pelophila TaxID=1638984 RepID=UPI0007862E37|nr:alpha/beta hydrolase [Demequina pelophila]
MPSRPAPRPLASVTRLAAGLMAAGLALAGCTTGTQPAQTEGPSVESPTPASSPGTGGAGAAVAPEDSRVYDQEYAWSRCGDLECATIQVPVDWADPDGDTIEIALNRYPATDEDARLGSLLINPGGPGASGLDLTAAFATMAGERVLARYDVIGFDPRGVGLSTPVDCGDGETLDSFFLAEATIESEADLEASRASVADFAASCRELSGPVVENADTTSAARDMDVIRALVGDDRLNYLGYSYGTQLGATYAALYPERVGRMVLDGAFDFLLPEDEISVTQAAGFESALGAFLDWCPEQEGCPLADGREAARAQVQGVVEDSLAGDTEQVVQVFGIIQMLYDDALWSYLSLGLEQALDSGRSEVLQLLGNYYLDRDPQSGEYTSNTHVASASIGCLDSLATGQDSLEEYQAFQDALRDASPTFAATYGGSTGCEGWPYRAQEPVTSLDGASSAGPIVVIGTTNDPATPYAWAESLTDRLASATLLTFEGEGHTAYGRSNQCILDAVDDYLVDGTVPAEGTVC